MQYDINSICIFEGWYCTVVVCSRPLCNTLKFLALKKNGFSEKKKSSQKKKIFFFTFFLCKFSVRTLKCFQFFFFFFLPTKSLKNLPQKLLIIGPNLLFHSPAQPTANSPKSIFYIIKNVPPSVCSLVCGPTLSYVGF